MLVSRVHLRHVLQDEIDQINRLNSVTNVEQGSAKCRCNVIETDSDRPNKTNDKLKPHRCHTCTRYQYLKTKRSSSSRSICSDKKVYDFILLPPSRGAPHRLEPCPW